jgi:tRNA dimethylallyltransferase
MPPSFPGPPPGTVIVAGPTGAGKSGIAALLAARLGGEIVNADASQLFRGLDVITAKPGAEERRLAPHHLFGVLPLEESCDAQRYRDLALPVLWEIHGRGALPIVVGGSGLYLRALTHGLDPLPPADAAIRAEIGPLPLEEKVRRLLELDASAASNVPLANPRYVERALEICLLTGRPQSELRPSAREAAPGLRGFCLLRDRAELHVRINQRVLDMLEAGALEEARVEGGGIPEGATAGKIIGLRELRDHLAGRISLDEAVTAIQTATRRYAKRQMTWFRRETAVLRPWEIAPGEPAAALQQELLSFVQEHHRVGSEHGPGAGQFLQIVNGLSQGDIDE